MNSTSSMENIISHPVSVILEVSDEEWNSLSANSINGTIFHSKQFLDYHAEGKFQHYHLGFERRGNLVGVMPGAVVDDDGKRILVSHPGASYGGPAWSHKLKYHHVHDLLRALIDHCREEGFQQIRLTPRPIICSVSFLGHLYTSGRYSFRFASSMALFTSFCLRRFNSLSGFS